MSRLARWPLVALALALALAGCTGSTTAPNSPPSSVDWVPDAMTQPVPSWGSPVRLALPVPVSAIVLGPSGGLGAFGGHQGGHVEGLNHVWIPIVPGTTVGSWADGTVTAIEDHGDRGDGSGAHEYFILIDYGQGLVGKHLDVTTPLVQVGAHVTQGQPVAQAPSAEFQLIDNMRADGERTGGLTGSPVSPFDYLRDADKTALLARFQSEVVTPYFAHGQSAGNSRPWEPALTNPMLFHAAHRGTLAGEWLMTSKPWNTVDPLYFDVMTIFDVTNAYGSFQRVEVMDHDWAAPSNKRHDTGSWTLGEQPGTAVFTLGTTNTQYFARYAVEETGGRATLRFAWSRDAFPATLDGAAVYTERAPLYLLGDVQQLGIAP